MRSRCDCDPIGGIVKTRRRVKGPQNRVIDPILQVGLDRLGHTESSGYSSTEGHTGKAPRRMETNEATVTSQSALERWSLKFLRISAVSIVVAGVAVLAYAWGVARPRLTAVPIGDRWRIEGRFLGEYALGFERLRITDAESDAVICDVSGRLPAGVDLARGFNTAARMFGPSAEARFLHGSDACQLMSGRGYLVTAWGNNGWGNVRPSSIRIRF